MNDFDLWRQVKLNCVTKTYMGNKVYSKDCEKCRNQMSFAILLKMWLRDGPESIPDPAGGAYSAPPVP